MINVKDVASQMLYTNNTPYKDMESVIPVEYKKYDETTAGKELNNYFDGKVNSNTIKASRVIFNLDFIRSELDQLVRLANLCAEDVGNDLINLIKTVHNYVTKAFDTYKKDIESDSNLLGYYYTKRFTSDVLYALSVTKVLKDNLLECEIQDRDGKNIGREIVVMRRSDIRGVETNKFFLEMSNLLDKDEGDSVFTELTEMIRKSS